MGGDFVSAFDWALHLPYFHEAATSWSFASSSRPGPTVQARARTGGSNRSSVGLASTFVPWFPEGPVALVAVAIGLRLVYEKNAGA